MPSKDAIKKAEELTLQVLESQKEILGEKHPDTLNSMNTLALTYSKQGCHKKAEELALQVLECRQEIVGERHPDTLNSMNNLAVWYAEHGRHKEAGELTLHVLEFRKEIVDDLTSELSSMSVITSSTPTSDRPEALAVPNNISPVNLTSGTSSSSSTAAPAPAPAPAVTRGGSSVTQNSGNSSTSRDFDPHTDQYVPLPVAGREESII